MRYYTLGGKLVWKNCEKYRIDWEKKSRSKVQFATKQFLKPYWHHHVCFEEFPVFGTRLSVDILNASLKIAIEVQGHQHEDFNEFFHCGSRRKYFKGIKNDLEKRKWLELNEFQLIEIYEDEVKSLSEAFFLDKFKIRL